MTELSKIELKNYRNGGIIRIDVIFRLKCCL